MARIRRAKDPSSNSSSNPSSNSPSNPASNESGDPRNHHGMHAPGRAEQEMSQRESQMKQTIQTRSGSLRQHQTQAQARRQAEHEVEEQAHRKDTGQIQQRTGEQAQQEAEEKAQDEVGEPVQQEVAEQAKRRVESQDNIENAGLDSLFIPESQPNKRNRRAVDNHIGEDPAGLYPITSRALPSESASLLDENVVVDGLPSPQTSVKRKDLQLEASSANDGIDNLERWLPDRFWPHTHANGERATLGNPGGVRDKSLPHGMKHSLRAFLKQTSNHKLALSALDKAMAERQELFAKRLIAHHTRVGLVPQDMNKAESIIEHLSSPMPLSFFPPNFPLQQQAPHASLSARATTIDDANRDDAPHTASTATSTQKASNNRDRNKSGPFLSNSDSDSNSSSDEIERIVRARKLELGSSFLDSGRKKSDNTGSTPSKGYDKSMQNALPAPAYDHQTSNPFPVVIGSENQDGSEDDSLQSEEADKFDPTSAAASPGKHIASKHPLVGHGSDDEGENEDDILPSVEIEEPDSTPEPPVASDRSTRKPGVTRIVDNSDDSDYTDYCPSEYDDESEPTSEPTAASGHPTSEQPPVTATPDGEASKNNDNAAIEDVDKASPATRPATANKYPASGGCSSDVRAQAAKLGLEMYLSDSED